MNYGQTGIFPQNCFSRIRVAGLNSLISTGAKIGLVGFGGTTASITVSHFKFFDLSSSVYNEVAKTPVLYTMPYPPAVVNYYHIPLASFDATTQDCEFTCEIFHSFHMA